MSVMHLIVLAALAPTDDLDLGRACIQAVLHQLRQRLARIGLRLGQQPNEVKWVRGPYLPSNSLPLSCLRAHG